MNGDLKNKSASILTTLPTPRRGKVWRVVIHFEHIARTWGWLMDEWATRVVTLLTEKAFEAFAGVDEQQSGFYEDIKAAVLAKYNQRRCKGGHIK